VALRAVWLTGGEFRVW